MPYGGVAQALLETPSRNADQCTPKYGSGIAVGLQKVDNQIADFFSSWNIYTTILVVLIVLLLLYPVFFSETPDIHPFLLARQSRPGPTRNTNESAVYRSNELGPGFPLRSGLNVRPPGAPKWSAGKDGDLRDIWRAATDEAAGPRGSIMTINGKDAPIKHELADLTQAIGAVGQHLLKSGNKVAIYLPNCVEYLGTVFASAFYGMSTILLPYNQPHDVVLGLIKQAGADCLVAEAGTLPLAMLAKLNIKSVVWVVPPNSRAMDWSYKTGSVDVATWHDLVAKGGSTELPADLQPGTLTQIWMEDNGKPGKITEFTQGNLVSAIAGLGLALPLQQRIIAADLVLPADTFSNTYTLCYTLSALYSRASLAINSVAAPSVELPLATMSASPSIIIASPGSLASLAATIPASLPSAVQRYAHSSRVLALAAGRMPVDSWLVSLLSPPANALKTPPGKLRLILTAESAGTSARPLDTAVLNGLRIATGARISYALSVPEVAGAIAQSNPFDYRTSSGKSAPFGPPLTNVEIRLLADRDIDVDGHEPKGKLQVRGPCVAGGTALLDVVAQFAEDGTLRYA